MSSSIILEVDLARLLHCTELLVSSSEANPLSYGRDCKKLQRMLHLMTSFTVKPAAEFLHAYSKRIEKLMHLDDFAINDSEERSNYFDVIESLQRFPNFGCLFLKKCESFFFNHDFSNSIVWLKTDGSASKADQVFGNEVSESLDHLIGGPKAVPSRFLNDVPDSRLKLRKLTDKDSRVLLGVEQDKKPNNEITGFEMDLGPPERDKILADMLDLATELKTVQMVIRERVRADINVLHSSSSVAHSNAQSLASVSRRVQEELGHKFGLCVWVFFIISLFVFFWMVLFMKFIPKFSRS